jgi:hypothetical protein
VRSNKKILLTRNSAYYIKGDVCVAVRTRVTSAMRRDHPAIGARLIGARIRDSSFVFFSSPAEPQAGQRVIFDNDVMTSVVAEIRPWEYRPLVSPTEIFALLH